MLNLLLLQTKSQVFVFEIADYTGTLQGDHRRRSRGGDRGIGPPLLGLGG